MVFRDAYQKKNLYWKYVEYETLNDYCGGINYLQNLGWTIKAIVCDGKRGLFKAFENIPVQMCQFHQVAIVTRYITKNPKLDCGRDLKKLIQLLSKTDKESFTGALFDWNNKWKDFLNDKTFNYQTGKFHFTHKRLRSAYKSIKTNLPYLFTWYDNLELKIPNTTNSLEGTFSNIKSKLRVHSGLKKYRKIKLIDYLLSTKIATPFVH